MEVFTKWGTELETLKIGLESYYELKAHNYKNRTEDKCTVRPRGSLSITALITLLSKDSSV